MARRNGLILTTVLACFTAYVPAWSQNFGQLKQAAMESLSLGDFATAQGYWQDALNLADSETNKGDNYVISIAGLALSLEGLKKFKEAEELYRRGVVMRNAGFRSQAMDNLLRQYMEYLHAHRREQEANELIPLFSGVQSDPNDQPVNPTHVFHNPASSGPSPSPHVSTKSTEKSKPEAASTTPATSSKCVWTASPSQTVQSKTTSDVKKPGIAPSSSTAASTK